MFSALTRYATLLFAAGLLFGLAACTTTDTGSTAVIEDSSIEAQAPAEEETVDVVETIDESAETEVAADVSEMQPADELSTMEEESFTVEEEMEPGPTTGAAEQTETVEPVAEFPIQRYEIEEPREVQPVSESDAEIERLRKELEATESELEQMRAEEEQREYSPSESMTSTESSGEEAAVEPARQEPMTTAQAPTTDESAAQAPMEPASRTDIADLAGMPAENSIYFGYDQAGLDSQYESVVFAAGEFLKANPDLRVEIQGNCDERGSREYNIALGQRRAMTVKRALELLGVSGNRIDTVSFGSEKPVAFGHDEASWRLNRRADIVYVY